MALIDGILVAVDGFMLVTRKADMEEGEVLTNALLPAKMLQQVKPTPKRLAKLSQDGKKSTVSYVDVMDRPVDDDPEFRFTTQDATPFPKYPGLFPGPDKKARVAISVSLLRRLLSTMPDDGILRVGVMGERDPIEFSVENMDRPISGAIMPMYVDWSQTHWRPNGLPADAGKSGQGPKGRH